MFHTIEPCPYLRAVESGYVVDPWTFPGKSTGVGCHFLLQGIFLTQGSNLGLPHCRQIFYHLKQLFVTPWTIALWAPLSVGFSRQEYWSGLPFPSPGDLPDPGIEPRSSTLGAEALTSEPPGKPIIHISGISKVFVFLCLTSFSMLRQVALFYSF